MFGVAKIFLFRLQKILVILIIKEKKDLLKPFLTYLCIKHAGDYLISGIDLTQNLQDGNADNSFAHQYPQIKEISDDTQKTSGCAGSVNVLSEETSQTEDVCDGVESNAESKSHKSSKDVKNREASSKDDHDKENVKIIKKGLPNKIGTTASKKLSKKMADLSASKSLPKSGIHAPEVFQCMVLLTHNFSFLSLHVFHLTSKLL